MDFYFFPDKRGLITPPWERFVDSMKVFKWEVLFRCNVLCKLSFFHILPSPGNKLGSRGNAWPEAMVWASLSVNTEYQAPWTLPLEGQSVFCCYHYCPWHFPLGSLRHPPDLLGSYLIIPLYHTWQRHCWGQPGWPGYQRPTPGQAQYLLLKLLPTLLRAQRCFPTSKAQLSRSKSLKTESLLTDPWEYTWGPQESLGLGGESSVLGDPVIEAWPFHPQTLPASKRC